MQYRKNNRHISYEIKYNWQDSKQISFDKNYT